MDPFFLMGQPAESWALTPGSFLGKGFSDEKPFSSFSHKLFANGGTECRYSYSGGEMGESGLVKFNCMSVSFF